MRMVLPFALLLSVRFGCNRGRGTWKSPQKNQLELGAMARTRAMCAPGSLHDHHRGRTYRV